jgi:hypothetical protein
MPGKVIQIQDDVHDLPGQARSLRVEYRNLQ